MVSASPASPKRFRFTTGVSKGSALRSDTVANDSGLGMQPAAQLQHCLSWTPWNAFERLQRSISMHAGRQHLIFGLSLILAQGSEGGAPIEAD